MEPESKRKKGMEYDPDSWDVLPVLSDEKSQDIKLLDAYAAPITEKRETSRLIKDLAVIYPLLDLQHIKRVRACKDKSSPHSLEVILCLAGDVQKTQLKSPALTDLLNSEDFNLTGLGEPFLVQIPASPPLTRPQFEQASKHWPTSFHEDKQVTFALKGELFTVSQKAKMQEYMMIAVQAAKCGRENGMEAVGAVIVDPQSDQVLAVGHDLRRGAHPLHHAVMVCIDLVAHGQGGGVYQYDKYPSCRYIPDPRCDSDLYTARSPCSSEDAEGEQPYICSGYDLYVTREPCVMCAMALVHSRISRVFYGVVYADGALGSKYKLHCLKDLNHHFDVYKGVMQLTCKNLTELKC